MQMKLLDAAVISILASCASQALAQQPPATTGVATTWLHASGRMDRDSYTVASGDTLYSIARRAGVGVSDLMRWNGIDASYKIHAGQTLRLSASPSEDVVSQGLAPQFLTSLGGAATAERMGSGYTAAFTDDTGDRSASPTLECGADGCRSDEGLVFELRTRSYDKPVTVDTTKRSTSEALQPDRRVTIGMEPPGRAEAQGRFSVTLPGGGVIWATEDPTLGQPELSLSAPSLVPFDGSAILRPVSFMVRTNYSALIKRMELAIYSGTDSDLIKPLAKVPIDVAPVASAEWDGALPPGTRFRYGDELVYVLRAFDAQGNVDETHARRLQLVRREEAEQGRRRVREATELSLGTALSEDQAQTQSLINDVFSQSTLRYQNIPIYGSRIRVQGRNLPVGYGLLINGDSYPVDLEQKFAAEYLMPVGKHRFDISLQGPPDTTPAHYVLDVNVTGRYFFGVGFADVTAYENNATGPGRDLAQAGRTDDILSDGRLAFYVKGKARGKYLITAQADTQDRPLEDMFDGFTQADPQDIFRRLDPDLYYPTYGDDSTTVRDVDTMGRFYVRADWDKSSALWGNSYTGFTGTEFAQYSRSLYGAALNWRSRSANEWGDASTELRLFGSEAQTAPGHSEFIGTGGSLYYLRHTDVLPGSDHVVLEVRDRTTGRVERRIELQRGADYEIDELQGRILLTRALSQITLENIPSITRDTPLDGFEQRLLVDYEWVPSDFDAGEMTVGVRGKHWFGDHFAVGLTDVEENRAGEDYTLRGADLTLQAGKGTYLKLEHSGTESASAPIFFSDNGGLSFAQLNPTGLREGDASAVEARANLQELGWTEQPWSAGAWWRDVDAGYSISRYDTGLATQEQGAELLGQVTSGFGIYTRVSRAERGSEALSQAQLNGTLRLDDDSSLTAEVRRIDEEHSDGDEISGTLGALRATRRFGTALDLYSTAQVTMDDDDGKYAGNDAFSLGTRYNFTNLSTLGAEATTGDRGDAATVSGEYRLTTQHSFYGGYTLSTDSTESSDSTEYNSLFNNGPLGGWTFGQRWRLSNQVNLFNESQQIRSSNGSGLAHTYGLDFYPAVGWNLGLTLSDGELIDSSDGTVQRRAVSLRGGRTSPDTGWQSKVEWRRDTEAQQRTQWVTTNRLTHKFNDSWRIAARFNYSKTDDKLDPSAGAKFIEGNVGAAYRPWNSSRWGLFARYSYMYDLASLGQVGGAQFDQKSQVLAFEGDYRINHRWEVAAKLAQRVGEARFGRGSGTWFDSRATLAAGQARYELLDQWHALAEYRRLDVKNGGTKQGVLVGLDRDLGDNLRIGAGYNFTDFSDDLTQFDYEHKGWFVNFTGSY